MQLYVLASVSSAFYSAYRDLLRGVLNRSLFGLRKVYNIISVY